MNKHPLSLLSETKSMNIHQFKKWLQKRTTQELRNLTLVPYSLNKNIENEKSRRRRWWIS